MIRRLCGVVAATALVACRLPVGAPPAPAPAQTVVAGSPGWNPRSESATAEAVGVAGSEIRVGVGETARTANGALEVTFVGVLSDSRCPRGEACVWEGDAVVLLRLRAAEADEEAELHTAARGPRAAYVAGWRVELLDLQPSPVTGQPMHPEAYTAALRVTRGHGPDAAETATR
jgi:hypothetical protein